MRMGYYFEDEDKEELLDMIDINDVVDYLGIERDRKNAKGILCPGHNDTHFGNCFINKNNKSCYCYACGKSFDAIDLLTNQGFSFYDALIKLSELTGTIEKYNAKKSKTNSCFLSSAEWKMLGVSKRKNILPIKTLCEKPKKEKLWEYVETSNHCYYIVLKKMKNPIEELKKEDFYLYKQIIVNKCEERIQQIKQKLNNMSFATSFLNDIADKNLIVFLQQESQNEYKCLQKQLFDIEKIKRRFLSAKSI